MREAAAYFIGRYDFSTFMSEGSDVEDTVRCVTALSVERAGDLIEIRISADGFLYNMVRIIAGTLLKVGGGHILPEEIENIIAGKDRALAGPTAPAKGLTLVEIRYPDYEK